MKHLYILLILLIGFSACEKEHDTKLPALDAQLQGEWVLANQSGGIMGSIALAGDRSIVFDKGNFTTTYATASEQLTTSGSYIVFEAESFVYDKVMHVVSFEPQGGIRTLVEIDDNRLIITEDTPDGYVYVYEKKKAATK